jgi:hypothetical protein
MPKGRVGEGALQDPGDLFNSPPTVEEAGEDNYKRKKYSRPGFKKSDMCVLDSPSYLAPPQR